MSYVDIILFLNFYLPSYCEYILFKIFWKYEISFGNYRVEKYKPNFKSKNIKSAEIFL